MIVVVNQDDIYFLLKILIPLSVSIFVVKKHLAYFLLIVYLFSFTETKQLFKTANLVEHFILHKAKNPDFSVYAFFKMHYFDKTVKDADYKEDMKLPFKTHDCYAVSVNLATPPKIFEFSFECRKLFLEKKQHFTYSESYTSSKISSVFRPPIVG